MALWPSKKEQPDPRPDVQFPKALEAGLSDSPGGPEQGTASAGAAAADAMAECFKQFGQWIDETKREIAMHAGPRQPPSQAAGDGGGASAEILKKLDAVLEKLGQPSDSGAGAAVENKLDALWNKVDRLAVPPRPILTADPAAVASEAVKSGLRPVEEKLGRFDAALQRLETGLQEIAAGLRPAEPEPVVAAPAVSLPAAGGDWQEAIFGSSLAQNPALDFQRNQLLREVLDGQPAACTLAGHLLIFRSSPPEKMPAMLKDIGEAYYRWQPRTGSKANEMEKALVAWLQDACEQAGIANTIELVHPGERFDLTRHTTAGRGVEITEVLGWIVLRDNGKVYTKASVAVK